MAERAVSVSGVSRAGGVHLTPAQDFVFIEDRLVTLVGTRVADHGDSPHNNARTANATSHVTIEGVRISRDGEPATCGHPNTNGSNFVFAE